MAEKPAKGVKATAEEIAKKDGDTVGEILFTQNDILKRAKQLGKQITKDFEGEELYVICTLKGGVIWMSDLIKNINLDTKIEFICASSYGSASSSSGCVTIKMDVDANLYDKNILIVEDIIDTGTTLAYIVEKLSERNPKSLKICTMLDKPSRRKADVKADYTGFEVDDLFIVGYGLDYDQKYRGLPYVSYLTGPLN